MLELKQTQKLQTVLTPQLQQAIKLLQLSQIEIIDAIEQEIKENPILEVVEEGGSEEGYKENTEEAEKPPEDNDEIEELLDRFSPTEGSQEGEEKEDRFYLNYENLVKKTYSLRDHLRWQAGLSDFNSNERLQAEWIIENIDDNGYLAYSLDEISLVSGYPANELEAVLKKIQRFDPSGIGARDLKECILIQYEAKGGKDPIFLDIVGSYFEMLQGSHLKLISKKTGYSTEKIRDVLEEIKSFDPKPGRNYSEEQTSYIIPDIYVVKTEDGFEIFLNNDNIPELRMNKYYLELYQNKNTNADTKRYIKNKTKQAEWFIKSLQQRQKTLYLVAQSILKYQAEFFETGIRSLKPLNLKDVAMDIGFHESTVSRITTNKYISTPHGIFEMKFFFPTGIDQERGDQLSTNVVMDFIRDIVAKEDKHSPLTDDEIVIHLKEKMGVKIARRTVAKYRDALNIRSSRDRRVEV